MPDMYEKLGDLLSEALESGNIKQETSAKAEQIQDRDTSNSNESDIQNCDKSGLFYLQNTKFPGKKRKIIIIPKKDDNPQGEIIKMHKYTEIMHIPSEVQSALITLDIAYPYTWNKIKHKYKILLKENHPDTKDTIPKSDNVLNNRQLTIDEIKYNFEILQNFFQKLNITCIIF